MGKRAVYAIRFRPKGWIYIGSASVFSHRWSCHKSNLRQGRHPNRQLQGLYDAPDSAEDDFEIGVLQFPGARTNLRTCEEKWKNRIPCFFNKFDNPWDVSAVEQWPHPRVFPYPVDWRPLFEDRLFLALSPELDAFLVRNLSAFGRAFGLEGIQLSQVARERLEQHRGWRCRKLHASPYRLARTVEWRQLGPDEPLPL